jgi:hypothetical protein
MTTATEIDLHRSYTDEETDAMFDAFCEALENGNDEEANRILEQMPLHPRWAKIIRDNHGVEYLKENFNITEANRVFGERWLNGE